MNYYVKLQQQYETVTIGPCSLNKAKKVLSGHKGYGYVTQYGRSLPVLIKTK